MKSLSANVLGKPCVGKPQARFDEEALESLSVIGLARQRLTL